MEETLQEEMTEELHSTEDIDWEAEAKKLKAEARKWEQRAKENKAAADELDAIKQERMSEQEKLQTRAEAAEARIAELEAEAQRKASAQRISAEKDVPADLLLYCSTEEEMEEFAEKLAQQKTTPSAPSAPSSRIVRDQNAQVSNRDQFAADAARYLDR